MRLARKSDSWLKVFLHYTGETVAYSYIESELLSKCRCEVITKKKFWGSMNPLEDAKYIGLLLLGGVGLLVLYCFFLYFQ